MSFFTKKSKSTQINLPSHCKRIIPSLDLNKCGNIWKIIEDDLAARKSLGPDGCVQGC